MEEKKVSAVKDLLLFASHTDVIHHVPGRIRVRARPSALKAMQGMDVGSLIDSIPGVINIRVNPAVASVVIEYDTRKLPFDLWERIRQLRERPDFAAKIEEHLIVFLA